MVHSILINVGRNLNDCQFNIFIIYSIQNKIMLTKRLYFWYDIDSISIALLEPQ